MLLKVVYFLFVVLVFRLFFRMIRLLFASPRSSIDQRRGRPGHPAQGRRVVDVEFTEDKR